LGGRRTRGSLITTDALASLCLSLILLSTAIYSTSTTVEDLVPTRVAYYQKIADQILLTSAMNGWISKVAEAVETRTDHTDHTSRIASLCPQGLSCQVSVFDQSGIRLSSVGELHDTVYGEARYISVTKGGNVGIVCRVSQE